MIFASILLFIIIFFVLGQVAWIYLDSKERKDKLALVWALLAAFPIIMPYILPLPLIIYLILTRAFSYKCPNCGEKVENNFTNCPYCSYELKLSCNKCKRAIDNRWNYCPYCSEKIDSNNIKK